MSGPSGVIVPPLPKRTESAGGRTPSVIHTWFSPAGPYTGTLFFFASAGAAHEWSVLPCHTRIRSTLPRVSVFLYAGVVFGLFIKIGSITITLPLGCENFIYHVHPAA